MITFTVEYIAKNVCGAMVVPLNVVGPWKNFAPSSPCRLSWF